MVEALRNSSSPIHCFSTTMTSRDQAERPPPNEANAIWLNVQTRSHNDGFTPRLCPRLTRSFMHKIRVVREIRLVMRGGIEWIRSIVMMRLGPIGSEHLF
jgi:hypothetical protein